MSWYDPLSEQRTLPMTSFVHHGDQDWTWGSLVISFLDRRADLGDDQCYLAIGSHYWGEERM